MVGLFISWGWAEHLWWDCSSRVVELNNSCDFVHLVELSSTLDPTNFILGSRAQVSCAVTQSEGG